MPINWIPEQLSFVIPSQGVPLVLRCTRVSLQWIRKMTWNARWSDEKMMPPRKATM
jgi:hypothetical protein